MGTVLSNFARLLSYPEEGSEPELRAALEELLSGQVVRGDELVELRDYAGAAQPGALEELFVRTFENNKERALELGWHLHGENYARGTFMARVRGLLRELGIAESVELPDHVTHLLAILETADEEVARAFATGVVLPALERVLDGFQDNENPYRGVVSALSAHLQSVYAESAVLAAGRSSDE